MFKNFLAHISIHKLGLIATNVSAALIVLFAILIINQEYKRYEEEIVMIEERFKDNETKKELLEVTKIEHKKKVMRYVIGIGGVGLFMFFAIFALLRVVSYLIENEMHMFISNFAKAAKEHKMIEDDDFSFEESRSLIRNANELVVELQQSENELKELNATLEQKVKLKTKKLQTLVAAQDEFIKKSIHEINTPLTIILTNIDLLKLKNITNKNITNIESGSKIIHNIFNDLSYMVKKDRVEYPKSDIDFSSFLKQRINFFDEVAKADGLVFITNIEDGIYVNFSEVKLQRVVDNNLSNAIKYSFENEPIFVLLNKTADDIIFEIKTRSPQIQDKKRIFDDFYRENQVRGGFGIGLNMVKDICDENGVKIELISDSDETVFKYIFSNNYQDKENENIVA